ncbi:hypothetical protein CNMCM8694_002089 [Aspergillus lentulus]|nr:hypothetical protein CNMCM8060_002423 [Aspergillus lentulus]KAF4191284.1 hypothetical protein CNMCM8694_002089 [Aspergillus lentulus]
MSRHFSFKAVVLGAPLSTSPGGGHPPPARQVKSRSGCEPCKRRRVKCDETRPRCRRCQSRNETCTGNFLSDTWQIERPWLLVADQKPQSVPFSSKTYGELTGVLENDLLRHWFDHACLTMAILPPPLNPLSDGMAPYLRRSKALRHTIQCVSHAHRQFFSVAQLAEFLDERDRALVSLQNEIDRAMQRSPSSQGSLLQTILLSSLLLGISSAWLVDDDYGYQYLVGTRKVVSLLLEQDNSTDDFLRYLLGLYVYWELCSSYIEPCDMILSSTELVSKVVSEHLASYIHPVTGIATSICPVLIDVGRYYRRVIELSVDGVNPAYEYLLESKLQDWSPEKASFSISVCSQTKAESLLASLQLLADSQRAMGMIMLYQARSVAQGIHPAGFPPLRKAVETIMTMLRLIPPGDPLLNSEAPLLVIAGSELLETDTEYRELVERHAMEVTKFTRVRAYMSGIQLVRDIWDLRKAGMRTTWLELMLQRGNTLSLV